MLEYGKGAYLRTRGNLPPFETVNMFVEESKTQGVVMQSRQPLVEVVSIGVGPIQASVVRDGVFAGDRFTISGGKAYRGAAELGVVTGIGPASIAVRAGEVLFNAGGPLYSYNGTDFVEVTFPDNSDVAKIFYTSGYFIALEAGTGYWFFSAVNNGRSWDALDFAEVETEPDALLEAVVLDGVIAFMGKNSVEFWAFTGNADLPFAPIQQRVFEQGVIAPGCAVQEDNSFFWIGADKIPYRNGDVPQAFGGDFLVERIEASSTHRVYLLKDQRHKFVCIKLDTETWAYDITTGEVFELRSYGRANFRCGPDYGDDGSGVIWAFGEYGSATETLVERILTAGERLLEPKIYDSVTVEAEVGTTPYLTGTYAEPTIEFRTSDDGGNVWEPWISDTLGERGDYRKIIEYRALGMFGAPGFLAQLRITDPVPFRLSGFYDGVNGKGRG
jgi:Phage stabilisation protein